MKKLFMTTAVLALGTSQALANDWQGFRAGLAFANNSANLESFFGSDDFSSRSSSDNSISFFAGYDRAFGNFIVGGELAYKDFQADQIFTDNAPFSRLDSDQIEARLRGGYNLGKVLAYGFVGYADLDGDDDRGSSAVLYGIGAEYKVTDSIFLGLELSKSDYDFRTFVKKGTRTRERSVDSISARVGFMF